MFGVAIAFTFIMNIWFDMNSPPLADYLFFFNDETHPHFYIWNLLYQLYMMIIIGVAGVAIEGPFILMTMFFRARFKFIRRLADMLDNSVSDRCNVNRLQLINTLIETHSDVLEAARRFSEMFQYVLLTQIVGSMGGEVFALYIIQTEFYFAMLFSAVAIMCQVFLYCFLGDMLVQVVRSD